MTYAFDTILSNSYYYSGWIKCAKKGIGRVVVYAGPSISHALQEHVALMVEESRIPNEPWGYIFLLQEVHQIAKLSVWYLSLAAAEPRRGLGEHLWP